MAAHDANGKSNSLNKPSNDPDLFDQLQDEFDALPKPSNDLDLFDQLLNEFDVLPSSAELPDKQRNVQTKELTSQTDPVLQDTSEFLSTADMRAFDIPSDEPAEPVAETVMPETAREAVAFEDDTTSSKIPSTLSPDMVEDSTTQVQEDDHQEPDSMPEPNEQANQQQAMPDNQTPDLDSIDPFLDEMDDVALEEKAPVHPDMSEDQAPQPSSGGRYVMISAFIVLAVAGGIYWFAGGVQEQPKQITSGQEQTASSQEQSIPETATIQPAIQPAIQPKLPDSPSVSPVETPQTPAKAQTAETVKASIQRESVEKPKAKQLAKDQAVAKRAADKKAKVAELAAKQAAEKRAAGE